MSEDHLLRDLNPDQRAAVTHGDGPQLVLAGAGSGKTRVITHRIAWLVRERDEDPARIVAVTFTNKAAAEMRERVENLLQIYPLPAFVGTFHRYSLVLLRRWGGRLGLARDFAILDTSDQLQLVKQALEHAGLSERTYTPRSVLAAISSAKNRLVDPAEFEREATSFAQRKIAPVYRRYQYLLKQVSGVDFDDMISFAVELLENDEEIRERIRWQVRHLLVDEFQDTNHAQLRLIRAVIGEGGNLTAVGDEDQGIYRWRGAELDNILDFEASFPGATLRKLEQNYRSTQNILDASGALVACNVHRRGKRLWTEEGAGDRLTLYKAGDEVEEARWLVDRIQELRRDGLPLSQIAVLVRTNAQTRSVEEELLRQEVPYTLVGGTRFYERAEIKDVVAYLRFLRNPRDTYSLLRIINQPPRGIGKATLDLLQDEAARLGQPQWDVIQLDELQNFSARAANALREFHKLIVELREAARELPLPELLERLLHETGYVDLFDRNDPDGQARLENLEELLSAAQELTDALLPEEEGSDPLTAFLDHVSLVSDIDSWQADAGVSVMTLHSAKGLEFEAVLVAGLEDGLLPHFNAQGTPEDVEEERRLLYVGMTRAREKLMLSCCRRRRIAGRFQDQKQSPFLDEIPDELVEVVESPSLFRHDRATGVQAFFGRGPSAGRSYVAADEVPFGEVQQGSRVRHPSLGEGVVLEVDGDGADAKLTVFFDRAGKRRLMARYANLEPV
jgi:DNA helicase II / ATP-dependent DNA helicase PcrA